MRRQKGSTNQTIPFGDRLAEYSRRMPSGTHLALGVPETAAERTIIHSGLSTIFPIAKFKKIGPK